MSSQQANMGDMPPETSSKKKRTPKKRKETKDDTEKDALFRSLTLVDSVIQFLTRATGQAMVPIKALLTTIPSNKINFEHFVLLLKHQILQVQPTVAGSDDSENDKTLEGLRGEWNKGKEASNKFTVGFPLPSEERLSGSTKTAAKRRLAALKRRLKGKTAKDEQPKSSSNGLSAPPSPRKDWKLTIDENSDEDQDKEEEEEVLECEKDAWEALKEMLGLAKTRKPDLDTVLPSCVLPRQISYAGTHSAQDAEYNESGSWKDGLDPRILAAVQRRLYEHQAIAIESALRNIPTMVCTGTGSGKSLCFMIPVLNAALNGERSMLLFPTKALAQDQVVKLQAWLMEHDLHHDIRAATLDGDTPHSQRVDMCMSCNIILTNPDTLHAAIMPNWKHLYRPLLSSLRYVVLDEAHMYTGVFGAHVSMILARLYRLVCLQGSKICFLSCSATLAHPEAHFRLLCCIPKTQEVNIVKHDSSPRAAKHFWVWNPPILDLNGKSIGRVHRRRKKPKVDTKSTPSEKRKGMVNPYTKSVEPVDLGAKPEAADEKRSEIQHRRHSADETALLLALAVSRGVRCIAFCKTRCLVEWVYERTLSALKQSPKTADLCQRVESYRGGYTKAERRQIEERLFHNELLGVVGTSALELGVDIGGVDLTLHCGFPSSHENLIQQSGRAGRGANASTSLAICVCFNSPMDQHLWRHPTSLLSRHFVAPLSMPIYPGLVQGHLLCAGQEFPLAGELNASVIQATENVPHDLLSDQDLFGSKAVYEEALLTLLAQGSLTEEKVAIHSRDGTATIYKTRASIQNPWTRVSIRSIEPVSYQIVDTSHPKQGGRTDGIFDDAAVLDTIPYSRVFYHAFPGAVITHRSRRYKITCMTRPPAFGKGFRGSISLGAFAKPCNVRYATRPLSTLLITIVKQIERVDVWVDGKSVADAKGDEEKGNYSVENPDVTQVFSDRGPDLSLGSFAGCGVVTVKRNVHGYKKLSMVTREEISRSELSLPDMEFDSFAFWLDCNAEVLCPQLGEMAFGHGIHALAHAMVAVAPLFVPCTVSDVYCDHNVHNPTKVIIFDARAGGSGICAQLWKSIFIPNGIVEAAVDLLEDCPSCRDDLNYDGGCPACLQAGECLKFNDYLSKSSGQVIGRHLLNRVKATKEYKENVREMEEAKHAEEKSDEDAKVQKTSLGDVTSPRRKKRERALRYAKDMSAARDRLVVVGRPSWPMDRSDGPRQEKTVD